MEERNPEERIEALERQVAELQQAVAMMREYLSGEIGANHSLQAAIVALVVAHPDPGMLAPILRREQATASAQALFTWQNEAGLQAQQSTEHSVALALQESMDRAGVADSVASACH